MMAAECHGQVLETRAKGPEKGTLVICGGGTLPEPLRGKVVELAGGEFARIVVVATASQTADLPDVETYIAWWRRQKLAEMTILHTRSREVADSESFVEPLKATEVFPHMVGHSFAVRETVDGTFSVQQRVVVERRVWTGKGDV